MLGLVADDVGECGLNQVAGVGCFVARPISETRPEAASQQLSQSNHAGNSSFGRLRDVIGGEAIELAILSKPDSLRAVFDREQSALVHRTADVGLGPSLAE